MKRMGLLLLLVLSSSSLMATPSFLIDAMGKLNFLDDTGKLKESLDTGSIAADIKIGDQKFRVSYGRDLSGNPNIIIYSNPSEPSDITLRGFGNEIKILDGGVLTIVATPDGNDAVMKSGILGKIQVGNKVLKPNSMVNLDNGQMTDQPIFQKSKVMKKTSTGETAVDSGLLKLGATAHRVEGAVSVQYAGQTERPLVPGDILKEGATIRTGSDGNVYLSPYPQSLAWLEPNSEMVILELGPDASAGLDANILLGVNKGNITSTLQGVDHTKVSYKIKTPRGVAAARGTTFRVISGQDIVISITDGGVSVNFDNGAVAIDLQNGVQANFTPAGGTPVPVPLTADQIAAINSVVDVYNEIFGEVGDPGQIGENEIIDAVGDLVDVLEDAIDGIDDDLDDGDTTPTN